MRVPRDSLRRIASGEPTILDLQLLDQEMPEASLKLITGGSGAAERARVMTAAAKAGHPSPVQDIAWMAVRERGLSHRNPESDPLPGYHPPPPLSPKAKLLLTAGSSLACIILGLVLVTWEPDTAPGAATPILWGIFFILAGLAIPVIAVIIAVVNEGRSQHRAWLDSRPPSEQARSCAPRRPPRGQPPQRRRSPCTSITSARGKGSGRSRQPGAGPGRTSSAIRSCSTQSASPGSRGTSGPDQQVPGNGKCRDCEQVPGAPPATARRADHARAVGGSGRAPSGNDPGPARPSRRAREFMMQGGFYGDPPAGGSPSS